MNDAMEEIEDEVDEEAEDMILLGLRAPEFIVRRKSCILYPNDTFFIYWDMWISLVLLVSCLITPVNFAFQDELDAIVWYVWFNYMIDMFFFLELITNFNTAYSNSNKDLIDDRK